MQITISLLISIILSTKSDPIDPVLTIFKTGSIGSDFVDRIIEISRWKLKNQIRGEIPFYQVDEKNSNIELLKFNGRYLIPETVGGKAEKDGKFAFQPTSLTNESLKNIEKDFIKNSNPLRVSNN